MDSLGANVAEDFPVVPLECNLDLFIQQVALVAGVCGSSRRRRKLKLPADHICMVERKGLETRRRLERTPVEGQVLSKLLFKARRRVE
jgi:hypothetical protein